MKRLTIVLGIACVALAAALGDDGRVVVHPKNTGEALINPGMGWVCFH